MKKLITFLAIALLSLTTYAQNGICMIIMQGGETTYHDAEVRFTEVRDLEHSIYVHVNGKSYSFHYTVQDIQETKQYYYFYNSDNSVFGINKDDNAEYRCMYRVFTTYDGKTCELFMLFNK